MFHGCAVDGDAYAQVVDVLFDESLYFLFVVVDAVGRKTETIGVEPMVVAAEHLGFQIVTNAVYQVDFKKRFSPDKIPNYRLFGKFILVEYVVYGRFGRCSGHTLLSVFPYQIAIFTSKLAILGDDKRNVFG